MAPWLPGLLGCQVLYESSCMALLNLRYKAPELHGSLKLSYYMAPELYGSLATWPSELSGSL